MMFFQAARPFAVPIYAGHAVIAGEDGGIVTVAGQPAARRILLIDRATFQIIRDAWSTDDGSYRFADLDPAREYLLLALDHERQYEPVAYDFVQPHLPAP